MKKFLSVLAIVITYFVIYFLQINFFNWFTIAGVKPNLFIVLALFIGLFIGRRYGIILGFLFGVYLDLIISKTIGFSGIMLALIGFLGGYFDKNFSKDSKMTIIIMVIGSTFIYEIFTYMYNVFKFSMEFEFFAFIKVNLIEIFYNVLLTIILYPLIQKFGYYLEDLFKDKRILTRYF